MIRTDYVRLTSLDAVAYRQKLKGGGSGIVIHKRGYDQPGMAYVNKRDAKPVLRENISAAEFPEAAFSEAIELTIGMPYAKRKPIAFPLRHLPTAQTEEDKAAPAPEVVEIEETEEDSAEDLDIVNSREYQAILSQYTDKKGALSYQLINRDMIQFAVRSKKVANMLQTRESVESIIHYIVGQRLQTITKNRNIADEVVTGIVGLLDEVSPRYVFKDLQDEIRKRLARR